MKFGGMISHGPRKKRLVFGSDRVKGQGQGHKKVKNVFLRFLGQKLTDLHETNARMCRIQYPILWYATRYGGVYELLSGWGSKVSGVMTTRSRFVTQLSAYLHQRYCQDNTVASAKVCALPSACSSFI